MPRFSENLPVIVKILGNMMRLCRFCITIMFLKKRIEAVDVEAGLASQ